MIDPPQQKIEELDAETAEAIELLDKHFEGPEKRKWDELNLKERREAIADASRLTPSSNLGRKIKPALRRLRGPRRLGADAMPSIFQPSAPSPNTVRAKKSGFVLSQEQQALLMEDPSNDYSVALTILRDQGNIESFSTSDDQDRRKKITEFYNALGSLLNDNMNYVKEIRGLTSTELAKDFYKPVSRFRGITLEFRKLIDQIYLCRQYSQPFTSFAEDRCWLSPRPELNSLTLKDKQRYTMKVATLSLLQKLADAGDPDSLGKMSEMYLLDDDGKPVQTITGRREGHPKGFREGGFAKRQTSHLCEPAHAGTGRGHSLCYNPAHLVAETKEQNENRKNCLGKMRLPDGTFVNVCPHGTEVDGQWINRCLGERYTSFVWELSDAQNAYLAPGVPRSLPEEPASRSPIAQGAPPATVQPSGMAGWLDLEQRE